MNKKEMSNKNDSSDMGADMSHANMIDHHRRAAHEAMHRGFHGKALSEHGNEGMRSSVDRGHVIEH